MGYYISSLFAVSPNDKHSYFIYFIPGYEFESNWINEWMNKQFIRIAQTIGPNGVIIAPSRNHDDRFLAELLNLEGTGGCLFDYCYSKITGKPYPYGDNLEEIMLHRGEPLLLLSRTPLQKDNSDNQAMLIRLTDCLDEKCLSRVIDILLSTIKNDNMQELEKLNEIFLKPQKTKAKFDALEAVELKPNFFGVGVNFNYILRKIAEKTIERMNK